MGILAKIEFKIEPDKSCDAITKGIRNKAIRIGVNAGAAIVKEQVINLAPKLSGALQESIRIKVKNYQRGDIWVALIGPKSKWAKKIGRGKNQSKFYPGRYFKHVEFGTKYQKSNPFMQKAASETAQAAFDRQKQKIGEQIDLLTKKNDKS